MIEIKPGSVYYMYRTEKLDIFPNAEELKVSEFKESESPPTLYFTSDTNISL